VILVQVQQGEFTEAKNLYSNPIPKYLQLLKYLCSSWNVLLSLKGETQIEGVWEQGAESIWVRRIRSKRGIKAIIQLGESICTHHH
jgi:hypothetical protein